VSEVTRDEAILHCSDMLNHIHCQALINKMYPLSVFEIFSQCVCDYYRYTYGIYICRPSIITKPLVRMLRNYFSVF
jgi:hypothetical protein